jgi:lysophospholipase L1-like esterase
VPPRVKTALEQTALERTALERTALERTTPLKVAGPRPVRVAVAALVILLAGCAGTSGGASVSPTSGADRATSRMPLFYVSLGDSYAAGYQPTGPHSGRTDTNGFAYQIPALAAKKGYDLELVNFGCAGATTSSILTSVGCVLEGPGATRYPTETQAQAAEDFLKAHRGKVGLVTVSIGGNDVVPCASVAQTISCVVSAVPKMERNLATLVRGLREAAGPTVPIVGTTYPDVILGLDLSHEASQKSLAVVSVTAFKDLINPALEKDYTAVGGSFVDVTAATGAYGPLTATTDLPPYGNIPVPVAKICELTFFCEYRNIHPRTAGYTIIAELVVARLPRRQG